MPFILPCLDARADTRLTERSKESLSAETDGRKEDDEECVLTMASRFSHDDKLFLRSKISMLESDEYANATKILTTAGWHVLPLIIEKIQDVGCLQVTACGHCFSGLPLLYTIMSSGFKCPICRCGGNAKIDLSANVPEGMCANLWTVLSVVCDAVRKRDKMERNHDVHFSTLQIARQTITVVYQNLPWVVRFVLYKEAHPGMTSEPFAQIAMKMKIDRSVLESRPDVWPDMLQLSAGVRGSSARKLTAQMGKCASFFVEIDIDIETTRHVVFQSVKMPYKRAPFTMETQTCHHTPTTIGQCTLEFKKCPYGSENLLTKASFQVVETRLRSMIIGIAGLG